MEDSGLNRYLDEIGRESLLTADEERQLSCRIKAGDQRALSRLVEANLRFVVKVANQYKGHGLALDDLISEGNLGLMKAATKFDADHGTRFVNYAVVYVRQYIERAIALHGDDAGASRRFAPHQENAPGQQRRPALSVDAPLGTRSHMNLLSVLVNRDSPMADAGVYNEAMENAIEFALLSLSTREADIVNRFYGLDREHETMAEIAADLGLKRERVRQIRNKAIRRIRKSYRQKLAELRR